RPPRPPPRSPTPAPSHPAPRGASVRVRIASPPGPGARPPAAGGGLPAPAAGDAAPSATGSPDGPRATAGRRRPGTAGGEGAWGPGPWAGPEGADRRVPRARAAGLPGGSAGRGGPTVLEGDEARVPRVLRELDGAALAHIAAHGTFRADSPLFSSLRMADGPLIVHDFERLDRSPYRIILPCCDTARFASVGADELLGLVTALLPLGTAGVVACTAPVNDAAVVPLMLALHKGLDAGLSLAEALRDARASLPGDAVHQATGWAFTAFGAA
ncbi:CHAT domain-containing protein, partial [Streptomyces ardesiacus]|uniref:CHAT domain-containing protein n=1 Tax=Streptomyces ardesiacus TaxID=285564 RepID=UPI0036C0453D